LTQQSALFGIDLIIVIVVIIERGFFFFDLLEQLVNAIKFSAFALRQLVFGERL